MKDKNQEKNSQIAVNQDDSSVAACSNFAVVKEKIRLSNTDKHIQAFKGQYDALFAEF